MSDELPIGPEEGLPALEREVEELLDRYRHRRRGPVDDPGFLSARILALARRLESVAGSPEVESSCDRLLNRLSRLFLRHFVWECPGPRRREVRRIFFIAAAGGLCNRLRAVGALSAVSELSAIPFHWSWSPNGVCPGSVPCTDTLESLGQMDLSILAEIFLGDPSRTLVLSNPVAESTMYRRFLASRGVDEEIFGEVYRGAQRRFLGALTESCGIASRIEETRGRLGREYRAAHVRRTDKLRRWNKLRPGLRFPSTEDYAEILDELLDATERFFLCCDDATALQEFRSRYGERAVTFEGEFGTAFRQTSLEHSVADLVLLSGASLVVGTPESSFSSFAIHAGNAESRWPCSLPETFTGG